LFERMDTDRDGLVSYSEFAQTWLKEGNHLGNMEV
jgi:Ca2+-binding EF-hand superfamily protein